MNRRSLLCGGVALIAAPWMAILQSSCSRAGDHRVDMEDDNRDIMQIHYLEIVTPDVEASIALYSKIHGISFGSADKSFGNAHIAKLPNGGTLGIRAPMRDAETPVVRPYFLVQDIEAAVAIAASSGAEIAMTATEIPGHGRFAIVIQGGIESGLWQVK